MESEGFSLRALVAHVASELREVHKYRAIGENPVLEFSGCELEIAVTVGSEKGGGLKVWVLGANYKGNSSTVSRIKLNFGKVAGSPVQAPQIDAADDGPEMPKHKQKNSKNKERQ